MLILILPLFGFSQSLTIDSIDLDKSQYIADSLWEMLSGKPDKEKVLSLLDYGKMYSTNNRGLSISLTEKALELAKEADDPLLISTALNGLSRIRWVIFISTLIINVIKKKNTQ